MALYRFPILLFSFIGEILLMYDIASLDYAARQENCSFRSICFFFIATLITIHNE